MESQESQHSISEYLSYCIRCEGKSHRNTRELVGVGAINNSSFAPTPWARSFWVFSPFLNHMRKFSSGDIDYVYHPYNQGSIRHLFIVAYRPSFCILLLGVIMTVTHHNTSRFPYLVHHRHCHLYLAV